VYLFFTRGVPLLYFLFRPSLSLLPVEAYRGLLEGHSRSLLPLHAQGPSGEAFPERPFSPRHQKSTATTRARALWGSLSRAALLPAPSEAYCHYTRKGPLGKPFPSGPSPRAIKSQVM
jgi:hypothetical protein